MSKIKAPFVYIGGKSRVAKQIWGNLGNVRNYIEPFCGSAAVLLARPHPGHIETLNDRSHFIANFWRAVQANPEKVAEYADWPINEADLRARHLWLMIGIASEEFRWQIQTEPDYYDAKVAGWWAWGQNCWIGSGWCEDTGDCVLDEETGRRPQLSSAPPNLGKAEEGPGNKRPMLSMGNSEHGRGTHAQVKGRPQLGDAYSRGRGVHGNDKAGSCEERRAWLLDWMQRLQDRLRTVRVCCGDWARVCSSPTVTNRLGTTGIFLDPPYAHDIERMHAWVRHLDGQGKKPGEAGKATNRDKNLYGSDKADTDYLVARVHRYCREWGEKEDIRIVLAGLAGEHDDLEDHGWETVSWKSSGYSNRTVAGQSNSARERLWVSPNCVGLEVEKRPMFAIWERELVS
jgi:DNA adenine methylase